MVERVGERVHLRGIRAAGVAENYAELPPGHGEAGVEGDGLAKKSFHAGRVAGPVAQLHRFGILPEGGQRRRRDLLERRRGPH
jgi:hypothetical protein